MYAMHVLYDSNAQRAINTQYSSVKLNAQLVSLFASVRGHFVEATYYCSSFCPSSFSLKMHLCSILTLCPGKMAGSIYYRLFSRRSALCQTTSHLLSMKFWGGHARLTIIKMDAS